MTRFAWMLGIVALCTATLAAQSRRRERELVVERATEVDADGLRQWAAFQPQPCKACKGTKITTCAQCERLVEGTKCLECGTTRKSPCRACAGRGETADPLLEAPCPGCGGASIVGCSTCQGGGSYVLEGGNEKGEPCVSCRGEGAWPCEVCGGERRVEPPRVRPSVGEASLKRLQAARARLEPILEQLAAFQPGDNVRKAARAYAKTVEPGGVVLPPLRRTEEMLDQVLRHLEAADRIEGSDERKQEALQQFVARTKKYLEHQTKVLDLCIARLEANDKAGKKGH